ncbi:uncharacterized protein FIBRA_09023 [Fibroporia radiculosa]|uniref:Uncharacterized protein n=1 Tax=Fibroporia radiculosa TaxID=599839 RepID=J4H5H1_9APHY|nr:uncharacterized protein FIBRA_09023 [Fibroporia radiculosa]CCM06729.1 predicted protein [Fibroporia radiculosa]
MGDLDLSGAVLHAEEPLPVEYARRGAVAPLAAHGLRGTQELAHVLVHQVHVPRRVRCGEQRKWVGRRRALEEGEGRIVGHYADVCGYAVVDVGGGGDGGCRWDGRVVADDRRIQRTGPWAVQDTETRLK